MRRWRTTSFCCRYDNCSFRHDTPAICLGVHLVIPQSEIEENAAFVRFSNKILQSVGQSTLKLQRHTPGAKSLGTPSIRSAVLKAS